MEPNMSQALHLLNGDVTNSRINQGKVVQTMLKDGKSPALIIDDLYLRCYSRLPRENEKSNLLASIDTENPTESLTDIFWALLNSKEFIFNH